MNANEVTGIISLAKKEEPKSSWFASAKSFLTKTVPELSSLAYNVSKYLLSTITTGISKGLYSAASGVTQNCADNQDPGACRRAIRELCVRLHTYEEDKYSMGVRLMIKSLRALCKAPTEEETKRITNTRKEWDEQRQQREKYEEEERQRKEKQKEEDKIKREKQQEEDKIKREEERVKREKEQEEERVKREKEQEEDSRSKVKSSQDEKALQKKLERMGISQSNILSSRRR